MNILFLHITTKGKLNSGTVKIFSLNYSLSVIITDVNSGVFINYQRPYKELVLN